MDAHVALEESPVEELVEARFAFTDPRGRVTRWGEGAEALLGIPAEQVVGQPLFDVALMGADAGWQAFLMEGREQCPSSRLEVSINRPDGQVFPCVVHLVPVLLEDGLDFSQFAADLGLDHGDSLDAFKERHQRVLGMIESAARKGAQYAEGERLAGLIATFRPSGDGPVTPGERIDEALSRAERAEREVEDLRDPLSQVAAEFADVRAGLQGIRERIEALEVRAAEAGDTQAAVAALATEIERMEQALPGHVEQAVSAQLEQALPARIEEVLAGQVQVSPAQAPDEEALAGRIEAAVAQRVEQAVAARMEEALGAARQAREEAEQVARELRAGRTAKTKPLPIGFYTSDGPPSAPDRPSLPDFDDVSTPLAMLSLDGRFTHLNGPFRTLVGYSEEEFASARWPSPAFTEHMGSQRELRRALAAGELDDAPVETAYMHREGLLVPLIGRMTVVRDERGVPDHLLFSVGAP